MGEFDALISGHFVVEFFERTKFPQRSLDIYIKGAKAGRLVPRLIQKDGYLRKMPTQPFILSHGVEEFLQ